MSLRQRKQSAPGTLVETAKQAEKRVKNRVEKALLVLWDDLPPWQQDNHYIHSGYRPASGSFSKSFASLGYLHNESVNIYSHLIGAVIFSIAAGVLYKQIKPRYDTASSGDVLAFSCFFLGATLCLGMSATYHAISNHSQHVARFGNKLDYVGIVFLITGSFIPSIYYGFYCQPRLQKTYWTMVSSTASLYSKQCL
jgi:adiponectin receptor